MSHAENPMSDSVNQPRTFEVLTAAPVGARRKPRDWPNVSDKLRPFRRRNSTA